MYKRKFRIALLTALVFTIVASALTPVYGQKLSARERRALEKRADQFHENYLTIDTHNDAALNINNPNRKTRMIKGQITFPLMEAGGLDAAVFAVFVGQKKRDQASLDSAKRYVHWNIQKFREYVENYPGVSIAYNSDDLIRNKKNGIKSVMIAIENGYAIGKDLSNLKMFRDMGVRAITLSHSSHNDICDSSTDKGEPEHHGLSPFGREVIKEMNRLGIAIDISHVSTKSVYDILELSTAPVIATHSSVRALRNHKRNLTDDEIKAIAAKGGLIQIAMVRGFLADIPRDQVSVKHLADHIDYIKNLVGIEHVGLGSDFDGGGGVTGFEDVGKVKNLTVELMKRGYTDKELELFWGGNFIRFLKAQGM